MNVFEISKNLQSIYNTIEENDGEITPEIEEALSINEENLKSKLIDYSNLIGSLNSDIDACAAEAKRIALLKKQKENLVAKLSNIVAEAVDRFGVSTKSGGKYYDLGTKKIQVRNTEKCEVNEDFVKHINERLNEFVGGISRNGLLGQEVTKDFMEIIGGGFDKSDLDNIKLTITLNRHISDITSGTDSVLNSLVKDYDCKLSCDVSKSDCKDVLKNGIGLTYAQLVPSKSVTIK